jgi:hypothetical protein
MNTKFDIFYSPIIQSRDFDSTLNASFELKVGSIYLYLEPGELSEDADDLGHLLILKLRLYSLII